jgi:Ca2+-binding RTX toxin-like protein
MPTYAFETITALQARFIAADDEVIVTSGTGSQTTVIYDSDDNPSVTIGGRTVLFGNGVTAIAADGRFTFADGSTLYIGDATNNRVFLNPGLAPNFGAAYGGGGADQFFGLGRWLVQGNQGGDTIDLSGGNNTVYGGQDNDDILFGGMAGSANGVNFANGNKGDDHLFGSKGVDTLLGGQGNDTIVGNGGVDFINGNLGDDNIGGTGLLLGEGGNDTLTGGANGATMRGGDGDDRINTVAGTVGVAMGDDGDDFIDAHNPAAETLLGGAGDDLIISDENAADKGDVLLGDDGDDRLAARGGSNLLQGGLGNDYLSGGVGRDTLDGGTGADSLSGGEASDIFVLDAHTSSLLFTGAFDKILDWSSDDVIRLRAAGAPGYTETTAPELGSAVGAAQQLIGGGQAEVVAVQVGGDVMIFVDHSGANTIDVAAILVGRTLADISAANFL